MIKKLQHSIFQEISKVADQMQLETYVIGGFVRDLYLKRKSKDIDIVTIGSGIELAQKVSENLKKQATSERL
jgi:poly(A) polymerase